MEEKWRGFCDPKQMWPNHEDWLNSMARVYKDSVHINIRIVDTDLTCYYINRFLNSSGKKTSILDAGGGWGRIAFSLAAYDYSIKVVDMSEKYLEMGKNIAIKLGLEDLVKFEYGDLTNYMPEKNQYDAIMLLETIEYLSDAERRELLGRLIDALKPGSLLFITAVDKLAMLNFQVRRFLFVPEITKMMETDNFLDLAGNVFHPVTPGEFDQLIQSAEKAEIVDRRTLFHLDSFLMSMGWYFQSLYYYSPNLPQKLVEANIKLMDDPYYKNRGFFHVAVLRRKD
ncbi:hypothetical protein BBF96_10315 [Anoxybacter fermentans]|uniref:Methyltransferase domain-containing protein n=1 Tax=Anoxybacter fermentans TaxID=1323375 RepID=A0A3S9SZK8_9FIRM|nr:class I SAM-dependent methyltransferase [Anoxybacter fermentans]AZR73744.1 hypothetical protein BBF96_10315 [Anoxybacter fermentans]